MNPMESERIPSGKYFVSRPFPLSVRKALGRVHRLNVAVFLTLMSFPGLAGAQTAQLIEQLGRTVLYDDIAISPDGKWVVWVQSIAATTPKTAFICSTAAGARPKKIDLGGKVERFDSDPAWSPDSTTLALFSAPGETNQVQLWTVSADGSHPQKRTDLKGYAARPRWSRDGKHIGFLYIEGAGGGGPLQAAPAMTGVIDTGIHNQRIAVLDTRSGAVRPASPPSLHVYDYDWSPDDRAFVATAAPGPGDNNWWIAQVYTISVENGKARSVYKPSLQVAIPRWSPDGKSIAFIEGLMSDEGFHGGDLMTMSAQGQDVANRTKGRQASVTSLFWVEPGRILFTETVGGGCAISELSLADNAAHRLWTGAEGLRAFGNFPNFTISPDGRFVAASRSSFEIGRAHV